MKNLLFSLLFFGAASTAFAIPFTLRNETLKAIPLAIPGVMNPNLSPMSNSGVDLAPGQQIFFFYKNERYLLLEVTEAEAGRQIEVGKLIAQRKKELGLK